MTHSALASPHRCIAFPVCRWLKRRFCPVFDKFIPGEDWVDFRCLCAIPILWCGVVDEVSTPAGNLTFLLQCVSIGYWCVLPWLFSSSESVMHFPYFSFPEVCTCWPIVATCEASCWKGVIVERRIYSVPTWSNMTGALVDLRCDRSGCCRVRNTLCGNWCEGCPRNA